jgi:hypothetical protein
MARGRIVVTGLVVVLVAGGVTAAVVGSVRGAAPEGEAPAVPQAGAGSAVVTLSADAAVHPRAATVLTQMQRYFDAINAGDYASWQATVTPDRAAAQTEDAWKKAYRSTKDGTIRIDRIDDAVAPAAAGGLLVRVGFVSTQAVADAPRDTQAERICWHATLPLGVSPLRVGAPGSGSSVSEVC